MSLQWFDLTITNIDLVVVDTWYICINKVDVSYEIMGSKFRLLLSFQVTYHALLRWNTMNTFKSYVCMIWDIYYYFLEKSLLEIDDIESGVNQYSTNIFPQVDIIN